MPKTKRSKIVTLSKTVKKTRADKQELFGAIREAADAFSHIYVFQVENMRNQFLKDIRQDFKQTAKLFYGKTKVMAKALGTSEEEEYKQGLMHLASIVEGNVGLIFTNMDLETVSEQLQKYSQSDYARSGCVATFTVTIPEGPLQRGPDNEKFPNNMEPQLRQLGLPTKLEKGVLVCTKEHAICEEGKPLTTQSAHLLKHFYIQMAEFKVQLVGFWTSGIFTNLKEE